MAACILAYPILVHLSVLLGLPALAGVALVLLVLSFLHRPLRAGRWPAWLGFSAALALSVVAVQQGVTLYALYLPPVVLPAALGLWWAASLRPGQTPFVTRIATAIRGPLRPDYAAYTRAVTQLWVGAFAVLSLSAAALVLLAPTAWWSFITHFVNPACIGLLFLGEYLYRLRRFRDLPHPGFIQFIGQVARSGIRGG